MIGLSRQRGQTLTEMALLLPVLLLVLLGVFDFARAIYAWNTISNAAREGGRTAIVNQNVSDIRGQAVAQATGLGISSAATACPPSGASGVCVEFRSSDLSATCSPAALGCIAVVTVKYSFSPLTPIIGRILGPFPMTSTTKQAIESTCVAGGVVTCPMP